MRLPKPRAPDLANLGVSKLCEENDRIGISPIDKRIGWDQPECYGISCGIVQLSPTGFRVFVITTQEEG